MTSKSAINVDHLSKKFARSLKRAMTYGLVDIARAALIPHHFRSPSLDARIRDAGGEGGYAVSAQPVQKLPPLRPTEFWALNDVSFSVQRGECIGIIGHNGAGKSTLFSILSGIYGPTRGRVEIHGKLQALIALGAGFHPLLSGRENIYINAAILGMTTKQIDAILDRIIDFSELKEFIDAPIKNYSSGMLVRLGFSVAAHLEPDMLLVDEVLAVGDMSFQRKCLDFMRNLFARDTTVILVSHNMASIEAVAKRVIWLDKGRLRADGRPGDVIADYSTSQLRKSLDEGSSGKKAVAAKDDVLAVESMQTTRLNGEPCNEFLPGEPIVVSVDFVAKQRIEKPHFHFVFYSGPVRVFDASMLVDGKTPDYIQGRGTIRCIIPHPALMPNSYKVNLAVRSQEAVYDIFSEVISARFIVGAGRERAADGPAAVSLQFAGGLVSLEYDWDLSRIRS